MLGQIVFISCPGQSSLRAKESGQGWRTEPNSGVEVILGLLILAMKIS